VVHNTSRIRPSTAPWKVSTESASSFMWVSSTYGGPAVSIFKLIACSNASVAACGSLAVRRMRTELKVRTRSRQRASRKKAGIRRDTHIRSDTKALLEWLALGAEMPICLSHVHLNILIALSTASGDSSRRWDSTVSS